MAASDMKNYVFAWEGKNRNGNVVKGQETGPTEAVVKANLRRKGISPIRVQRKSGSSGKERKRKITALDIAVFTRQLATMMSAGVPLVQAFDIVGRGHENPSMRSLLLSIKEDIEAGTSLSESIAKWPRYFDDLYVNLIAAGEESGALESMLDKIAVYKEKAEALKSKIRKALTYPTAVIVIALVITGVLLYYVVPQFESLFSGFGADLPAFTQFVVALSEWVQTWWWAVLGGTAAFVAAFGFAYRSSPALRRGIDRGMLKLPILGPILHKAAVARYARTLATMFSAGVPLVDSLNSVSGATGNTVYQEATEQIRDQVSTGQSLQQSMEEVNLFPHMVLQMIAIGEESGDLDTMAAKVADFYEAEVDDAVDNLSSLLEPLIMVVLGVLVGGLVASMYLPIFQMGSAMS